VELYAAMTRSTDAQIAAIAAKSLKEVTYHLPDVLNVLCAQIEHQFLLLRNGKLEEIRKAYNAHLYQLEKEINFEINQQSVLGKVKEVNALGQLVIEVSNRLQFYNHGELKWILDARHKNPE